MDYFVSVRYRVHLMSARRGPGIPSTGPIFLEMENAPPSSAKRREGLWTTSDRLPHTRDEQGGTDRI
jgi:hypothetical protein